MAIGLFMTSFVTLFDLLYFMGLDTYVSSYFILPFTNLFEDFISMRYTVIVYSVLNAKITPDSVEATIISILTGVNNLGFGVIGSYHGTLWAGALGIEKH